MAHSEGFEPSTARFVAEYSIQLSYECVEGAYGNEFVMGRQVVLLDEILCLFIGLCLAVGGALSGPFPGAFFGPFIGLGAVIVCCDSQMYVWGIALPRLVACFAACIVRLSFHPVQGGLTTLLFLSGALI